MLGELAEGPLCTAGEFAEGPLCIVVVPAWPVVAEDPVWPAELPPDDLVAGAGFGGGADFLLSAAAHCTAASVASKNMPRETCGLKLFLKDANFMEISVPGATPDLCALQTPCR